MIYVSRGTHEAIRGGTRAVWTIATKIRPLLYISQNIKRRSNIKDIQQNVREGSGFGIITSI